MKSFILSRLAGCFLALYILTNSAVLYANEVTIDGTSSSSNVPVKGINAEQYQQSQTIYPESVLSAAGLNPNSEISKLTYYLSTSASASWGDAVFEVRLGTTSASSFSSTSFLNLVGETLVYTGPLDATGSTMEIVLSTPFNYTGGNLVIDVRETTKGTWKSASFKAVYVSGASLYTTNSSTQPPYATGTAESYRPKVTITYAASTLPNILVTPPAIALAVGGSESLTATTYNSGGATVTWSSSNTSVASVSSSGVVTGNGVGNATITAKMTVGGVDYTSTCNVTVANPTPFTDNFENTNGWTLENGSFANQWCWGNATSNGGSKALYISNDGGTTNAYNNSSASCVVYAFKNIYFEAGDYLFTYDWKANGESSSDFLRVALVPFSYNITASQDLPSGLSSSALPSGWIALDGGSKLNGKSDWQTKQVEKTIDAAGCYKMVFVWRNDNSLGSNPPAAIDNVSVGRKYTLTVSSNPSSAGSPSLNMNAASQGANIVVTTNPATGYYATSVTTNPFTSVNNNGDGTYSFTMLGSDMSVTVNYELEPYNITKIVTGSGNVTTSPSSTATMGQTVTITASPSAGYVLSGLAVTDASNNSVSTSGSGNIFTFTMPASSVTINAFFEYVYSLPFADNFESSNNWSLVNGGLTNQWCWGSATSNGGGKAIYVSNDNGTTNAYSNGNTVVYALKTFYLNADTYMFSYDWKAYGSSYNDYLRVVLVPSNVTLNAGTMMPSNLSYTSVPSGWIALDGGGLCNKSDWQTKRVEKTISTAGYYKMVFVWRNDASSNYNPPAAIDNVAVGVSHNITVETSPSTAGTATANQSSASAGQTITVTVTENLGYVATSMTTSPYVPVTDNGDGTYSFTMPDSDITATVHYDYKDYIIAIDPSITNGTASASAGTAHVGQYITINTTPDAGYLLSSITVTDEGNHVIPVTGTTNTRFFTMPASNVIVTAEFDLLETECMTEDFRKYQATGWSSSEPIPDGWRAYCNQTGTVSLPHVSNYESASMHGNYLLLLTRGSITQVVYAIMPRYPNVTSLSFNYRYENVNNNILELGYVTSNEGYDTYVPLRTIEPKTTITTYTVEDEDLDAINLAGGYVTFCCKAATSSNFYGVGIDDIQFCVEVCTPEPSSVDGQGITKVEFGTAPETVSNTSHPTSAPYYGDYSSLIGAAEAGETASVDITFQTSIYDYGTIIWVDWNQDLFFTDDEIVYTGTSGSSSPNTLTATFPISGEQTPGYYRMRIGAADTYFDNYIAGDSEADHDPCSGGTYKVFHDYTLHVTVDESCTAPETFAGYTPYNYNTNGELPDGWLSFSANGQCNPHVSDNTYNWQHISQFGTGNNYLLMMSIVSSSPETFAIFPRNYNISEVEFDYVYESASQGYLQLGYVTEISDYESVKSSFVPIRTIDINECAISSFKLTELPASFATALNDGINTHENGYIAFRYYGATTAFYGAAVDNIAVCGTKLFPHDIIVVADPTEGGNPTLSTTSALVESTITVTANPNEGDEVTSVTSSPSVTITDNGNGTYSFPMLNHDMTVTVHYQQKQYNITIDDAITNGTVTTDPSGSATAGEEVTIDINPDYGYVLNSITVTKDSDGSIVTVTGNTFTMPADDVTLTAVFVPAIIWTEIVTNDPGNNHFEVDGSGNVTVKSKKGLAWLISYVNGYNNVDGGAHDMDGKTVILTADIDMREYVWVPIGNESHAFKGVFDAQNHTIDGVHIKDVTEIGYVESVHGTMTVAGLFGYANGASIKNTFVNNSAIAQSAGLLRYLGGLVAKANNTTIEFCGVSATLSTSGKVGYVGGLAGYASGGSITAVTSTCTIDDASNNSSYVGGIIGYGNATMKTMLSNTEIYANGENVNAWGCVVTSPDNGYLHPDATATARFNNYSTSIDYFTNSYAVEGATIQNPTGSFSLSNYGYGVDNNTVDDTPLVDLLNQSVASGYKWIRAAGSNINGGYPIMYPVAADSLVCVSKTGSKTLRFGELNAMLALYADSTEYEVFMYNNDSIYVSPGNSMLYIDEKVALKQKNNLNVRATVSITFDNSKGNGEQGRDWHMFSSTIEKGKTGVKYGTQIPTFNTIDEFLSFGEGNDYWLEQGNDSVYFPDGITSLISNPGKQFDLYSFCEPEYHWINLKRATGNHWHQDEPNAQITSEAYTNETTFTQGKGYMVALGDKTNNNNNLMQAWGLLNNDDITVTVTSKGNYLKGYNLLGNPYQSYLDFQAFANDEDNAHAIWNNSNSMGYKSYLLYNADEGGFTEYLLDGYNHGFSHGAAQSASRYINMHQGFFVVKNSTTTNDAATVTFTNAMRVIAPDDVTTFRDEAPYYPLVNLFCTDSDGKREVSVIELERPSMAGSLKMKGMLDGKGQMYIHWNGDDFGSVFIDHMPDYVPVWFETAEEGVFTMTWSTANANFGYLHLIDNITGTDYDMLANDSYIFHAAPTDMEARFRLVFSTLGVEETETEQGENFAFIVGNELVVTGECELSLIDLNGRVLTTEHVSGQQSHITMPKVAVGMYMLRLTNEKGTKVQKIVVRR